MSSRESPWDKEPNIASIHTVVDLNPKLEGTAEGFVTHMCNLLDKDLSLLRAKVAFHESEAAKQRRYLFETQRCRDVLEATMEGLSEIGG